jgi:tRNA (cytidine/uridine-2'-O-)-methyltransferase
MAEAPNIAAITSSRTKPVMRETKVQAETREADLNRLKSRLSGQMQATELEFTCARTLLLLRDNTTVINVILFQPEIPPNTGNVIRLCANTGCALHLIEPLGFSMEDRYMRRAGLDYHEYAQVAKHASWAVFLETCQPQRDRIFAFTTRGSHSVFAQSFQAGDWLLFGSETAGLPVDLRESLPPEQRLRLPMLQGQRSLNLSNAVAVSVFEAWRQNGFAQGQ